MKKIQYINGKPVEENYKTTQDKFKYTIQNLEEKEQDTFYVNLKPANKSNDSLSPLLKSISNEFIKGKFYKSKFSRTKENIPEEANNEFV